MKLSIIVTHHQTPELLDLCLKSIEKTIGKINYEIIIVDSEEDGRAKELIKEKYRGVILVSFK